MITIEPSEPHVERVAAAIMQAAGKTGDWRRWRAQALAAIAVGPDPARHVDDVSLVREAEAELGEMIEWARTEAAPLREQEIDSISRVRSRLARHMQRVDDGLVLPVLRWIPIDEKAPKRSTPGREFEAGSRHKYSEYLVLVPPTEEGGRPTLSIASYWGARMNDDAVQHDWFCPLNKDETLQPSHYVDVSALTAALAVDETSEA